MRIWVDLCHIPHVPFFVPQIRELNRLGYETIITVRDSFQICELSDLAGVKYHKIGRHYGKRTLMKGVGLLIRAMQLYWFARKRNFSIAVSHTSPFQILAASLLGIPCITFTDYEHSSMAIFYKIATRVATPECIPDEAFGSKGVALNKVIKYPGLKEDVYVEDFEPNKALLDELQIDPHTIVVTIRPAATEAHYHNPESEQLFSAVMGYLLEKGDVTVVILPRTLKERGEIQSVYGSHADRIVIPQRAISGLNLMWHSDLVISGGGTMNREAAALGVPVYSIFRGPIGAVDRFLTTTGRLHFIETPSDVHKIKVEKRKPGTFHPSPKQNLKSFLVKEIISTASDNANTDKKCCKEMSCFHIDR